MIITVTLNPAVDKTVVLPSFEVGRINRVASMRSDAGGKGINVSKVIHTLGGKSKAIGLLAGRAGDTIKGYLDALGIENNFLFVEGETRTNLKILDNGAKTTTEVNESGPDVSPHDLLKLEALLRAEIREGDVVVISGSVPPSVDTDIYQRLIEACRVLGARTILDADGELLKKGVKAGPYLLKPNIHELEGLAGKKLNSVQEILHTARALLQSHSIHQVVVSMGDKGALYIETQQAFLAHGIQVEAKSTVGAGDAMVAALALSLEQGHELDTTIRLSMAAGIANVLTSGSQAAPYESVVEKMERIQYSRL